MEKGQGSSSAPVIIDDKAYENWKTHVPILYDWFSCHHLKWPSLTCRWGPQINQGTYKSCQRLYLAEQTDGTFPDTMIIINCEIANPRVAVADNFSEFNEEKPSPFVKECKTLIHPGEVIRIRELAQNNNILATHTDSPNVFIWNLDAQPNRTFAPGVAESRPDAILTGHTENAQFALAMCHSEPFVLSGGQDKFVVLWSIEDCITSLGLKKSGSKDSRKIGPRGLFEGHDATVEDVQFCPSSAHEFCSVGDDSCLILWDARSGNVPVLKVQKAHNDDVHCVDWNATDANFILTGSADHTVRMFDRRNLIAGGFGSPVQKFEDHKAPVLSVQWSPHAASVFASAAEDGILKIWDHEQVGKKHENAKRKPSAPGLFFQHGGHRTAIEDFHWNPAEPWTIASVSNDLLIGGRGGTLQMWRISDLIYRAEEDVIAELTQFQKDMQTCSPAAESQVFSSTAKSKKPKSKKANLVSSLVAESKKSKSKVSTLPAESKKPGSKKSSGSPDLTGLKVDALTESNPRKTPVMDSVSTGSLDGLNALISAIEWDRSKKGQKGNVSIPKKS